MQAAFLRNMLPTRHLYRQNFCPNSAWRRRIVCWRNRCSLQPETFTAGGVQRGLSLRLGHSTAPSGRSLLLSVATESNRIASAEATEAAKKVKSAIEVTQDTSQIPSHIPSATDEKAPQPLAIAAQVSYNEEDARNMSIFAAFGKKAKELLPL